MCILFWTVDNHPKYRFIFAGNRDEFLKRPTARAHFWDELHQNVLAGTDLEINLFDHHAKNGTWLGITKQGRFAALTNFREANFRGFISRGALVRDFLWGSDSVHTALQHVKEHEVDYGGFNLVAFDFGKKPTEMAYCTNRENQPIMDLEPAVVYGLSNSILTNPWPKVKEGEEIFKNILKENDGENEQELVESLFGLLRTGKPMTNVDSIPDIFKDLSERICIPKFDFPIEEIKEPAYATRTSTVVLVDHNNRVTFVEREWHDENLTPLEPGNYNDILHHFDLEY